MSDAFDSRDTFVARFGGVFEHSPWIAEAAWDAGLPADAQTADGLHAALVAPFRAASRERRLGVLLAHPDLAGRLAVRGELTADSTAEQASAGLDKCTPGGIHPLPGVE
ncbi:2-oxo-4-hydroxy-4-carboxy-5-ureidoimidazoline decarboxylase [Azospirillum sp. B4]|uniref:2-oxo-4-hydroxy-4-carboxy-5-ureidoimidazoline decarboxylase n=1 Tax=Azospirillum sp. B4 TaxID=95605 RepID=UPI00034A0106|nr:2-oxo-4-hydroxy-4-carboxy-5-ureidoimidazoline decarboxylase [Azospirillum sp. B4]